jgi:hypothetical protein
LEKKYVYTELGNYYGNVCVVDNMDGTFQVELEDYSGTAKKQISKELFDMMVKELG